MSSRMMNRKRAAQMVAGSCLVTAMMLASGSPSSAQSSSTAPAVNSCASDNGGITLPPGFCATVFADKLGHPRHLVVAPNGTVYVNTWSGRYYHFDALPPVGFLVALQDTTGSGRANIISRFGDSEETGGHGGTGIGLYKGALFAEINDRIVRYDLPAAGGVPTGTPEVVVSGMPITGDHPMHPFAIDEKGNLYVDIGSATNACQSQNRIPGSVGNQPCTEQETRGGTWRYDANKTGQVFSPAERFATGIRNGEGISFDSAGRIYTTQHGRDQLAENWPSLYQPAQGANLPAEEIVRLEQGGDYGWPECYFDDVQKKLVLAPEYGGDGGKTQGVCAQKREPIAFFPAHWAPNDLVIYKSDKMFPAAYREGAFIAFHGSWNRAPSPQAGYSVVFQPFADGKVSGPYVVFADGFAGAVKEPGRATHRPTGLAVGPDGALYIADDAGGRIWRVTYKGDAKAGIAAAPTPVIQASTAPASPPEGTHPDANAPLTPPPGATAEQLALGDRIFHGQASDGTCSGCHGSDAKGTSVGPDLTRGAWLWSDGSLAALTKTITEGVPHPKQYEGVMPPKGGAQLSDADVAAVASYVWAVGHRGAH